MRRIINDNGSIDYYLVKFENLSFTEKIKYYYWSIENANFTQIFLLLVVIGFLIWVSVKLINRLVNISDEKAKNQAIQAKFNCKSNEYTILEPKEERLQDEYAVLALSSGEYYLIAFSDWKPRKITVNEPLKSFDER
ncbi:MULTISPECIES: hypothetical protein [Listeria]|uniref:Uncharacterized protein n=1 Tax=Listeria riparia FSL S10-1204 TaxID=1265816 RepID=W7DCD3_9LIST|nr:MULTISPECIES: hypothetical protein [Listeria]EUJ42938.1 hypothetical protein PRIP_14832 [Listeria riparia FSL S10-1204]MBC2164630.1 hypothetical protein [Listeria booriae]